MLFSTKLLALVAACSPVSFAAPSLNTVPEASGLEKRNCPRYQSFPGSKAIAGLYLGNANDKSRQVERLIEEAIALIVEKKCDPQHIYVKCNQDGDHWGWKRNAIDAPEVLFKRTGDQEQCEKQCDDKVKKCEKNCDEKVKHCEKNCDKNCDDKVKQCEKKCDKNCDDKVKQCEKNCDKNCDKKCEEKVKQCEKNCDKNCEKNCDKYCDNKYPYKNCQVKCKTHDYC
ncbi:hypothetical protein MMC24_001112 [Lignoscripta atroalba]|nr:hypothetical protein [Lignoscripta atroalba]